MLSSNHLPPRGSDPEMKTHLVVFMPRAFDPFIHFCFDPAFILADPCVDDHLTSKLVPPDMRRDVQEIFRATPHHKQVMMFSATLSKEIRITCKKFMTNVRNLCFLR